MQYWGHAYFIFYFLTFLFFNFIFKLSNIVLFLPYIEMNPQLFFILILPEVVLLAPFLWPL